MTEQELQEKKDRKRIYMREYVKNRRQSDPAFVEKAREATRKSNKKRRLAGKDGTKEWKKANKEKVSIYMKNYREENKEKIQENRIKYLEENKEKTVLARKAWEEKNIEKIREYNREYTHSRYHSDPVFALKMNQRNRLRAVLKGEKTAKTHELIGCSFEELKSHIESKFVDGMGWHNMGEWHIDHIIPLAAFDLSIEENQRIAFNFNNLQPLWAKDNLMKGARYG